MNGFHSLKTPRRFQFVRQVHQSGFNGIKNVIRTLRLQGICRYMSNDNFDTARFILDTQGHTRGMQLLRGCRKPSRVVGPPDLQTTLVFEKLEARRPLRSAQPRPAKV